MLQQTTVAAVRGRYDAFLARFPDLPSLARARESSVLAAWSGLGYYARARNLHAAARGLVSHHDGRFPRDPQTLATLPGFGDYMAAAVASIAFGARVPAVDANVTRVVSRLFAIGGEAGTALHAAAVRARAAALLPSRRPGDLTAALMDLGQQICKPRRPECGACPAARLCGALAAGAPERFPRRRVKPRAHRVHFAAAVAERDGRVLLVRETGPLLRGMWLFPSAEAASPGVARTRLSRALPALGLRLADSAALGTARHTIVHRMLDIRAYRAEPVSRPQARHAPESRWLTPGALDRAAIPTLTRRIASAAGIRPRVRVRPAPGGPGSRSRSGDRPRRSATLARGSTRAS